MKHNIDIEETRIKNKQKALKQWKGYYESIYAIGGYLKYCRDKKIKLDNEEIRELSQQIDKLCARCSMSLERGGLRMPEPKWPHDKDVPNTWISHSSFKYGDCI